MLGSQQKCAQAPLALVLSAAAASLGVGFGTSKLVTEANKLEGDADSGALVSVSIGARALLLVVVFRVRMLRDLSCIRLCRPVLS